MKQFSLLDIEVEVTSLPSFSGIRNGLNQLSTKILEDFYCFCEKYSMTRG
jgi:hypothetical protein